MAHNYLKNQFNSNLNELKFKKRIKLNLSDFLEFFLNSRPNLVEFFTRIELNPLKINWKNY